MRNIMMSLALLLSGTLMAALTESHTICLDSTLTFRADSIGKDYHYTWSTGDTTVSLTVAPTTVGAHTYSCETYRYRILSTNNLMANGDFENYTDYHNPPAGFTSDYEYFPFDPRATDLYGTGSPFAGKSGGYLLSCNAHNTWRDYISVAPHGGQYFAMFDAAKTGFAWKVTTTNNPDMKLQKDGLYVFSYWAADLNKEEQRQHPARLQFSIKYKDDATGLEHKQYLGKEMKLGKDNKWHQSVTYWTAPCDASYIEIGVEDLEDYAGVGNDFGLDDIIFQMITKEITVSVEKQTFRVKVEDCDHPCEAIVYRKWNDLLFVDNSDSTITAYQWYYEGQAIEGATRQFLYLRDAVGEGLYSCEVVREDGTRVRSCELTFEHTPRSVEAKQPLNAPAAIKELRNGRLLIRTDSRVLDPLGRVIR